MPCSEERTILLVPVYVARDYCGIQNPDPKRAGAESCAPTLLGDPGTVKAKTSWRAETDCALGSGAVVRGDRRPSP